MLAGIVFIYNQSKINNLQNILTITNNKLVQVTNDKGQLESTIEVISSSNSKLLLDYKTADSTVKRLQGIVKQYDGRNKRLIAALAVSNNIVAKYQDSIANIITNQDTIVEGDVTYIFPTYIRSLDMFNGWIIGNVELGRNITNININVKSEYDISMYRERSNIFSAYKTYATITNLNPYDITSDMKVFHKDQPRNRFNVSAGVGVDVLSLTPTIGVYIGYSIIQF